MKIYKVLLAFSMCFFHIVVSAQIGYQVSLLNSATGEPRVAETVEVKVTLTNSEGGTIYEETKKETTNDFGILSLAVGNSTTFDDVDWSKLPFFISVSVDRKLVGKSQVLTVPVAEYAKRTGVLTKELLCSKTWTHKYDKDEGTTTYTFNIDGSGLYRWIGADNDVEEDYFTYVVDGNNVAVFTSGGNQFHYYPQIRGLVDEDGDLFK